MGGSMEVATAIELVNEALVFAPEWEITAEDFSHRFENTMRVNVNYPACQTNRDAAREGYPELVHADAGFLVVCNTHEITGLSRRLLEDVIFPIQHHEAREMLRIRPTFWAPFHPHKIEGMESWGDVLGDLRFGIT